MWILVLYLLNTVFMFIVAIREVRRPAKALNWLAIGLVLPVIGFGIYLITSNPVRVRRERLTSSQNESDMLPESFSRSAVVIAQSISLLSVNGLRACKVQPLTNGIETYERLIQSIRNAKQTIDLEYYIYKDDQIGRRITDLLIEQAESGVKIRFLRDGWGSRKFSKPQLMRMTNAGIKCRTIFPLRIPWISHLTYRDHCKIVVVDRKVAFTGGINVGDEYTGLKPDVGFWRDTHMRMTGEAVDDLQAIFEVHWKIAEPEILRGGRKISLNNAPPVRAVLAGWSEEWGAELTPEDRNALSAEPLKEAFVQTLEGNPGLPTQVIREAYFICLTQAVKTIDITTPYFVPDADIIMALKTAVARGVRVRMLVPRRVVPKIVGPASLTYYGELLEAGVQIYMYEKGMLHAKVMILDEEIAEIGASNFDMRSFRLNYEVCEFIYSTNVAKELSEQFERDLADSVPLHMEELLQRSITQRVIDQGARLFAPLL